MHPYGQTINESPERKKSSSNLSSGFPRFGRKESHQNLEKQLSPPSTAGRPSSGRDDSPRPSDGGAAPVLERVISSDKPNGNFLNTNGESSSAGGLLNGTPGVQSSTLDPGPSIPAEVFIYEIMPFAFKLTILSSLQRTQKGSLCLLPAPTLSSKQWTRLPCKIFRQNNEDHELTISERMNRLRLSSRSTFVTLRYKKKRATLLRLLLMLRSHFKL